MADDASLEPPQHRISPKRCDNCAGKMTWDAAVGLLRCESCDATAAAPGADATGTGAPEGGGSAGEIVEHDLFEGLEATRPRGPTGAGARQMRCNECGATVEFPDNVTARKCEFCDSSAVLAQEIQSDNYLPESLVPFKVDRATATRSFSDWLGRLWFRPSDLKQKAAVDELHGVYVPYWTFDCDVDSSWTADAGYYYWETEHYTVTVNGRSERRSRQVRKVRWVPASGQRHDHYDDWLVCASRGLPPGLATGIDNFDTGQLLPYSKEYLQGFSAESYAVDLPAAWVEGKAGIAGSQRARCAGDVPGDTQRNLRVSNRYSNGSFKHVLLPVWVAAFRYKERVFRFLVNGQTGQVAGTAPWSFWKIFFFTLLMVAIAVAIFLVWQRVSAGGP
jgi:hypothetical protein